MFWAALHDNSGFFGTAGTTEPGSVDALLTTAIGLAHPSTPAGYVNYYKAYKAYITAYSNWAGAQDTVGALPAPPAPLLVSALWAPQPTVLPTQVANSPNVTSSAYDQAAIAGMSSPPKRAAAPTGSSPAPIWRALILWRSKPARPAT